MYICAYVHMYVHTYVHMYVHVCICTFVYMCVCKYVHVCSYICRYVCEVGLMCSMEFSEISLICTSDIHTSLTFRSSFRWNESALILLYTIILLPHIPNPLALSAISSRTDVCGYIVLSECTVKPL